MGIHYRVTQNLKIATEHHHTNLVIVCSNLDNTFWACAHFRKPLGDSLAAKQTYLCYGDGQVESRQSKQFSFFKLFEKNESKWEKDQFLFVLVVPHNHLTEYNKNNLKESYNWIIMYDYVKFLQK